jgi:hypothetical protein
MSILNKEIHVVSATDSTEERILSFGLAYIMFNKAILDRFEVKEFMNYQENREELSNNQIEELKRDGFKTRKKKYKKWILVMGVKRIY